MKRFIAFVLTTLLFANLSLGISAYAASNTYELKELGLQVTIPDEYSIITRNTPATDPIFRDLGISKSALISHFEAGNIYFNAISNIYNEEIVVTMMENQLINNLALLKDDLLELLASSLISLYKDTGIYVSKYEIYRHPQATFIKVYFTDAEKTVHGLQYYTIYDGKAMNFTMRSYEGNLSLRQEIVIRVIVDSIKYDKALYPSNSTNETSSFVYRDSDAGVSFTVPANWKQEPFTEEKQYYDVKFAFTKDNDYIIMYGSYDLWSQIPIIYRIGFTRSDIDFSFFTAEDIVDIFGYTTDDKLSFVTYNGIQYIKSESTRTYDNVFLNFPITATQLVTINNGWAHFFAISCPSSHEQYSEFERLMKSVHYPSSN